MMVVLALCALVPGYLVGNWEWDGFMLMVLIYSCNMWCFETMAQLFSLGSNALSLLPRRWVFGTAHALAGPVARLLGRRCAVAGENLSCTDLGRELPDRRSACALLGLLATVTASASASPLPSEEPSPNSIRSLQYLFMLSSSAPYVSNCCLPTLPHSARGASVRNLSP